MENLILDCYDGIGAASGRMLTAAMANDWDALVNAESECAAIISRLQALGESKPLSENGARRKMQVIRKVLAEDAKIRDHTQPWMRSMEAILCGKVSERRVQNTYG
jgi:flagellar protein FliT